MEQKNLQGCHSSFNEQRTINLIVRLARLATRQHIPNIFKILLQNPSDKPVLFHFIKLCVKHCLFNFFVMMLLILVYLRGTLTTVNLPFGEFKMEEGGLP